MFCDDAERIKFTNVIIDQVDNVMEVYVPPSTDLQYRDKLMHILFKLQNDKILVFFVDTNFDIDLEMVCELEDGDKIEDFMGVTRLVINEVHSQDSFDRYEPMLMRIFEEQLSSELDDMVNDDGQPDLSQF
jgi:hypothetical protein